MVFERSQAIVCRYLSASISQESVQARLYLDGAQASRVVTPVDSVAFPCIHKGYNMKDKNIKMLAATLCHKLQTRKEETPYTPKIYIYKETNKPVVCDTTNCRCRLLSLHHCGGPCILGFSTSPSFGICFFRL